MESRISVPTADILCFICLVLTAERWFAVVKPHKYSDIFSRKRVICYIFSSWMYAFLTTATGMIETATFSVYICLVLTAERWFAVVKPHRYSDMEKRHPLHLLFMGVFIFNHFFWDDRDTVPTRIIKSAIGEGSVSRVLLGIFQTIVEMFYPCLVMIGLYIHMVVMVNTSAFASAASKGKLRGSLTRMVGVTCFMSIICYAPNQILLVLAMAGKTELDTPTQHATALLTFIASCVNPFIYGLSNGNYRQRYREILFAMCPRLLGRSNREEAQPGAGNTR